MGRLALAVRVNTRPKGSACSISVLQKQMTPEDLADLDSLLKDETIPASVIAQQLSILLGKDILQQTMNRHRRSVLGKPGGCTCLS